MEVGVKIPSLLNKESVMKASSFLILMFLCKLSFASVTPVSAPVWEEGFSWEYQVTPHNGPQRMRTDTVILVRNDGFMLQIKEEGNPRQAFHKKDGSLETDRIQYYKFPLTIGDSWKQEFQYTGRQNKKPYAALAEVKVVSREKIQTPAGEFDAIKIVSTMHYTRLDTNFSNQIIETIWYAPDVRKLVKFESVDRGSGRRSKVELIGCTIC